MKTLFIALLLTATASYAYDDISPEENRRAWDINEQNHILRQERVDRILQERRDRNQYEYDRYQYEQPYRNPYREDNQYYR
jgi:hypothetical protein